MTSHSGEKVKCKGFSYPKCRSTFDEGNGWCGEEAPYVINTREVVNGVVVSKATIPVCVKHKAQHQQHAAAARQRSRKAG